MRWGHTRFIYQYLQSLHTYFIPEKEFKFYSPSPEASQWAARAGMGLRGGRLEGWKGEAESGARRNEEEERRNKE